jgi:hypothetical protein
MSIFTFSRRILLHGVNYLSIESSILSIKNSVFWDITRCSSVKIYQGLEGTYRLHLQGQRTSQARNQQPRLAACFVLVSCFDYSSTLKLGPICSSQTSVDFQRTTSPYIPEKRSLHSHRCENLKSSIRLILMIDICYLSNKYCLTVINIITISV